MPKKRNTPGRNLRIADQIQRDLAELIRTEIKNPVIHSITVHSVELTRDYAHAKVYFTSLFGIPDVLQAALNQSAGHLRNLLFKRLHIHTVPTLHFIWDKTPENAIHIEALIREANAPYASEQSTLDDTSQDELSQDKDTDSI
jgi:ribosome-binding factor A